MKSTERTKDFIASIGVGLLSMVLFVLLMGTVVLWGQNTGQKVRSKLSDGQAQVPTEQGSTDDTSSQ
jgi:hypothetical protein